jgi:hypothetical protein
MGQKFTPDEFGQDKIEKNKLEENCETQLAVCGRSGPVPGSVLKSDPACHSRATSRLAQSPEIGNRLPSAYADSVCRYRYKVEHSAAGSAEYEPG